MKDVLNNTFQLHHTGDPTFKETLENVEKIIEKYIIYILMIMLLSSV